MLALSAALDAIDGTIARECAAPSALGGVFDLVSDRVVETAVIIGIAWGHAELYFPALALVGSWYVNITVFLAVGAALERHGPKLIEYPPGILERTEALVVLRDPRQRRVDRVSPSSRTNPVLCDDRAGNSNRRSAPYLRMADALLRAAALIKKQDGHVVRRDAGSATKTFAK